MSKDIYNNKTTEMMRTLLFVSCGFFSTQIAALSTQFCATISAGQADGAQGYVAMQIEKGQAFIGINMNLQNYPLNTAVCALTDFQKGLKYHIHSYWTNTTSTSAAYGYCGASNAGDHYDPNFACSGSSQAYTTSSDCTVLNRTAATHYTYACNTTNYNAGRYSMCEVGDLSGKNGLLQPTTTDGLTFQLPIFIDNLPAYAVNYNAADKNSLPWTSVVFHCSNSMNTRLFCAKFSTTSLAACQSSFSYFASIDSSSSSNDDDGDDNVKLKVNNTGFGLAVAFILLAAVLLVPVIWSVYWYVLGKKRASRLDSTGPMYIVDNPIDLYKK